MWYDAAMLAILAWTTFRGSVKGMAWQVAAIAALVLCFAFATPLSLVFAPAIRLDPPLNRWVAMLAIYLAFSFACFGVARVLRGWLETLKFEEYDRHLGALFGFVKGAAICLVVTFFIVCLSETACRYVLATRSGQLAGEALDRLSVVMPDGLAAVLRPHLRHFDPGHREDPAGAAVDVPDQDSVADSRREGFRGSRQAASADDGDGILDGALDSLGRRITREVRELVADSLSPDAGSEGSEGEDWDGEPPGRADESAAERAELLETLLGLLATRRDERDRRRTELEALLHGIPASVAADALRDWQADLRGDPADPDPGTDVATLLDARLARRIRAGGVDPESLPRPVRERLSEAETD